MSDSSQTRRKVTTRSAPGVIICPSCKGPLKQDSKWCPACGFTGSHTVDLFPDPPPPLLPILDAVGLLSTDDVSKVEASRDKLRRRFPQFHWRICIVDPPEKTNLPVFGFWLLNVCPLGPEETNEDRAWTVLLLINTGTGEAAIIPGYAAEPFLSDDEWKRRLATMVEPWRAGKPADAITLFFKNTHLQLELAWKRYGTRRSSR